MPYRHWHAFKGRQGWMYWGAWKGGRTPELCGPFDTEKDAQKHADNNRH